MFPKIRMPGKSYRGPIPSLTEHEAVLRDGLRQDIERLADGIGERNIGLYRNLTAAADYVEASLAETGCEVRRQEYEVIGMTCSNIEAEIEGSERRDEIVVVGAHYDSVGGSPGANDNASGVAAVLALNRLFAGKKTSRTLRFVGFANEEPPFFQSSHMGSLVYAKRCRQRGEKVVAMLSLETIGYYSDQVGSQKYPFPFGLFYPSTGNFIGFVGNTRSRGLVRDLVASFRHHVNYPSEGGALPGFIPGISLSDQWAFWQQGYPAVMVTDTAPFRYPYYHSASDTPDKLLYDRMAQVVAGLARVIPDITG